MPLSDGTRNTLVLVPSGRYWMYRDPPRPDQLQKTQQTLRINQLQVILASECQCLNVYLCNVQYM
jgi:hypothetical protein